MPRATSDARPRRACGPRQRALGRNVFQARALVGRPDLGRCATASRRAVSTHPRPIPALSFRPRERSERVEKSLHPPFREENRAGAGPGCRVSLVGSVGMTGRSIPPCLGRSPRPQAQRQRDRSACAALRLRGASRRQRGSEVGADPFSILGTVESSLSTAPAGLARPAAAADFCCEPRYAAIRPACPGRLTPSHVSRDEALRARGAPIGVVGSKFLHRGRMPISNIQHLRNLRILCVIRPGTTPALP